MIGSWWSCVTYEWVVSCMYDLCHIWKRHVIHECIRLVVVSHMNESCRASMIYVTYERGMSSMNASDSWLCHIWMSRAVHLWFMSYMKEACHIHECVRLVAIELIDSITRRFTFWLHSFVIAMCRCHTYEWDMSYTWMRQTRSYWADRLYHSSIHFLTLLFCNRHV